MDYRIICLLTMTFLFLSLWILIYITGYKKLLSKIFNIFVLNMVIWSFGLAMFYFSKDLKQTLFWANVLYMAGGLIPPSFLLYSFVFTHRTIFLSKFRIFLLFLPNLIFFYLYFFTPWMIRKIVFINQIKTFDYGPAHFLWDVNFNIIFLSAFFRFIHLYQKSEGLVKEHLKYIISGTFIGYVLAGLTNVILPWFGNCTVLWLGPPLTSTWLLCIAYTVIKHRILDIRVVIARSVIFIFVYLIVLGLPIFIGWRILGNGLWLLPVSLMGFFATLGPFIFLFIQKRTEDRLLQEQRRYQATLRQASSGMGKIKELIVYVLTHAIQIEHAMIYIYDKNQKKYILSASKFKSKKKDFINNFEEKSPLVLYLLNNKHPIILEEINQRAQDYNDLKLIEIERIISSLKGALLVPIFIDQDLTAIIIMGKKDSGKSYTEEDLSVFSILANQTALAIENAKFYEDMKTTHQQLFQAEKMATIGTMADGLSHQINNRFHALGFIAGDAIDTIRMNQKELSQEKMKEVMAELERAFVRVQDNVVQGGEIVQGLLKYTRKGEAGFTAVDIDAVFKAALEMVQFKIKIHELKIIRDYDVGLIPKLKGNFTQLQEVFFNLIDNGYDAMMQRKNEKKEADYQPTLKITVIKLDNSAQIIFEDNGIGVKDDDMHKLFTPFFTTKLSSKKGTGLGLYVIKKIVEDNHGGEVAMLSKYMQGTQMKLLLPIAIA